MQAHYSQSSRENATPYSGTSPLDNFALKGQLNQVEASDLGMIYQQMKQNNTARLVVQLCRARPVFFRELNVVYLPLNLTSWRSQALTEEKLVNENNISPEEEDNESTLATTFCVTLYNSPSVLFYGLLFMRLRWNRLFCFLPSIPLRDPPKCSIFLILLTPHRVGYCVTPTTHVGFKFPQSKLG